MKPTIKKEIKIGVAAIITLAILFYGINYLKGFNVLASTNSYYMLFEEVNGLPKSTPVFANGFRVGTVRDLNYDYQHPRRVVVEVSITPRLRIPADSHAEVVSDMLGNVTMNLILSDNLAMALHPGDTLPGRLAGGLMEQAGGLMPQVEQMLPKLDSILTSLNTLLADPALPATLHHMESMTANLDATSRNLQTLTGQDFPLLTQKLNNMGDNFIIISDNLKQIDYASAMMKIDSTLTNVRALTDRLQHTDNTVGLLLNDPALYNNLSATTANAASLLEDLQAHPKRYVHFSLFGKKDK